jgi:hypothetical protein
MARADTIEMALEAGHVVQEVFARSLVERLGGRHGPRRSSTG